MNPLKDMAGCRFAADRCQSCAPKESCAFFGIPELDQVAKRRFYGREFTVVRQGDEATHVFIMCSGWMQVTHITCAGRAVVDLFGPGTVFGLAGAVNGGTYLASAKTLEECEVGQVERNEFLNLIKKHPEVSLELLKSLGHQLQISMKHLYALAAKVSTEKRLLQALCRMAETCGIPTDAGLRIRFPLSVQMLADIVGCSRQWVSKLLGEMDGKGLIRHKSGWITVTNLAFKEAS